MRIRLVEVCLCRGDKRPPEADRSLAVSRKRRVHGEEVDKGGVEELAAESDEGGCEGDLDVEVDAGDFEEGRLTVQRPEAVWGGEGVGVVVLEEGGEREAVVVVGGVEVGVARSSDDVGPNDAQKLIAPFGSVGCNALCGGR